MWGAALQMYGVLPQMYGAAVLLIMVQFAPHGSLLNQSGIITLHNRAARSTTGRLPPPCNRGPPRGRDADARSCSRILAGARPTNPRPLRFDSHHLPVFPVDRADEDATLCSHAHCRACCPGPLLTPCCASCSSLCTESMPNAR